ncbi:unnamed protein product [Cylindrotheca closterium]|uniref:Uncharacterized protein n=1 Tax=Cylindrotheca closterium TaxID=2856 RepID=A0AAD2CV43_9STRA|nr:unnamed protein product [Cylindrotheca closterium]
MSSTPSWLDHGADPSPPLQDESLDVPAADTPPPAEPSSFASADEKDLPTIILYMRLANMGAAVALVTISVLLMVSLPPLSSFVLAIYATCGGLLICCLETQLKFLRVIIAVNFGFLFNSVWRFIFYMVIASVSWSYDSIPGKVVAGVWIGIAIFNTYVLCRYPGYRRIREKIAEEEDKRIEARISKEVKRQAVKQASK